MSMTKQTQTINIRLLNTITKPLQPMVDLPRHKLRLDATACTPSGTSRLTMKPKTCSTSIGQQGQATTLQCLEAATAWTLYVALPKKQPFFKSTAHHTCHAPLESLDPLKEPNHDEMRAHHQVFDKHAHILWKDLGRYLNTTRYGQGLPHSTKVPNGPIKIGASGAAPPTKSQLRLNDLLKVPVQECHTDCHCRLILIPS